MQSVGAAWLMVSLNAGPMYVALTQTASALPFFILALPAGTIGDIVDTSRDMFKIADLSRLGVMANVYEEDLPKLVALKADERRWEVDLLAEPGLKPRQGRFESIGNVLDPMQHTAIVKGWLDNPDGQLRVGQFVTTTVELPNRPGLSRLTAPAIPAASARAASSTSCTATGPSFW